MWKRCGTPTKNADGGTVHEFDRACAATSIDSRKLDGEARALLDDYVKQFQIGEPIPVSRHNDLSKPPHRQEDAVLPE